MVIYQIYPRSFSDSNHDGLGDLRGITEKLPYLKELGVEALWISPFFRSPMKDFGYDVSDYCAIDPMFGTMNDFDALMEGCQKLDLQVMIDMVLSHSSDQHPWFTESRSSRTGAKANWYVWADAKPNGEPPNNWVSIFGGGAWQWDEGRQQFFLHNFLKEQPDFNFHEPTVQTALLEACEFWLKKGVRGMRLDVCNFYFHSAELEDNPPRAKDAAQTDGVQADNPYNFQQHIFDKDRKENISFLKKLRALTDRYPGTTLMGEVVSDDSFGVMQDYIGGGGPLHTAYNFSLFKKSFNGLELEEVLLDVERRLPNATVSWALGNHDVPRFLTRFQAEAGGAQAAKTFLLFLFTLRGHVILYEGDELGLTEAEIRYEDMQDPYGLAFYPEFKGRDGCRTPFPWSAKRPTEKTWLPIPDSHLENSVEVQNRDPESTLAFTRRLIHWRRTRPWLTSSALNVLSATTTTLVIERRDSTHRLVAMINGGANEESFEIAELGRVTLGPFEFKIWEDGLERRLPG